MNDMGHEPTATWQFQHEAMATTFRIVLIADDEQEAQFAANEVFREIDQLETELSRFQPGSDVSRLNAAAVGDEVYLGPAAFDCLTLARNVSRATKGAFDVTIGPLFKLWRESETDTSSSDFESMLESTRAMCGWDMLEVFEDATKAKKLVDGMQIDLGGIGKGYALDQAAELLLDWDIEDALLSAGDSTVLAIGNAPGETRRGWPVQAGPPDSSPKWLTDCEALSGSGFDQKGEHIIDPRTGRPCPMDDASRPWIWAKAPNAALSDALSTAFMVMSQGEIEKLCSQQRGISAFYYAQDSDQ